MLSALINFLFPALCIACGARGAYLCGKCLGEREAPRPIEYLPGEKPWITALFSYKDKFVKRAIWDIKYHGKFVAAYAFGEMMVEAVERMLREHARDATLADDGASVGADAADLLFEDVVIVPIPPSQTGRKKRGYNQAAILARALYENASFPCDIDEQALRKVRVTEKQATLRDRAKRLSNMDGAFEARQKSVAGKIVILVDDVVTTGATLRDARRAILESGGAKEVTGVTIGH